MQNFYQCVCDGAPPHLPVGDVKAAIKEFEKRNRTSRGDVSDCIAEASRRAEGQAATRNRQGDSLFGGIEPETAVTTEVLLDRLKPRIEALRQQLWQSPDPPFATYAEAVAWIESEAEEADRRKPARTDRQLERILTDIKKLSRQLGEWMNAPVTLTPARPELRYQKLVEDDYCAHSLKPNFGSPLLDLQRFVESAASSTGFKETALVVHLLTGLNPGMTPTSVGYVLASFPPRSSEVTVTIRKSNPSLQDFRDAYGRMRRLRWNEVHVPFPVRGEDRAIFLAICRMGKLPQGRVPTWMWAQIASDLPSRFSGLTPHAVRMRVSRMVKRGIPRESLYQEPEVPSRCRQQQSSVR